MTPFHFHSEPIQKSWLDAYGHLNEAYYLVPFSNATWKMQDHFEIGVEYFDQTHCALYTVETHLRYLDEIRYPASVDIHSIIIESDAKRIWFAHQMVVGDRLCATAEFIGLHYNTLQKRTMQMPSNTQQMLAASVDENPPDWVGRQLSLHRKNS